MKELHIVTTFSPSPERQDRQITCLQTWYEVGAIVHAVQRVDDYEKIDDLIYDLVNDVQTIDGTGRIPVATLLEVARKLNEPVLILNADNELTVHCLEIERFDQILGDGCLILPRYRAEITDSSIYERSPNGDVFDLLWAIGYERQGIEGIYLKPTENWVNYFRQFGFALGEPWWDVIIPGAFLRSGLALYCSTHPLAKHEDHPRQWPLDLCHRNGVIASAILRVPVRNTDAAIDAFHEQESRKIREHLKYVDPYQLEKPDSVHGASSPAAPAEVLEQSAQRVDVLEQAAPAAEVVSPAAEVVSPAAEVVSPAAEVLEQSAQRVDVLEQAAPAENKKQARGKKGKNGNG